ncbi:MAG: hypothetical protein ACKVVT_11215, partial [Dehalococcoidia bacterium]
MAADAAGLAALLPLQGTRAQLALTSTRDDRVIAQITRLHDGAPAGEVELGIDGGQLTVWRLEVAPDARRYGLGSECGALIRELAARGGFETLRAWAPPGIGLAVYFWIRMGLQPQFGDGPHG